MAMFCNLVVVVTIIIVVVVVVAVVLLPHTSYGFIIDTNNKYGNVPEQRGRVGGTADER
jgi:preprotein translocase subunit SecG